MLGAEQDNKSVRSSVAAKRPDHLHYTEGRTRSQMWAAGFMENKPHHLLADNRTRTPMGQQQVFRQKDQDTYTLEVEQGHKSVKAGVAVKSVDNLPSKGKTKA